MVSTGKHAADVACSVISYCLRESLGARTHARTRAIRATADAIDSRRSDYVRALLLASECATRARAS